MLSNYRYNRIGGIDADKELESGEVVPYTLTEKEAKGFTGNVSPFDEDAYNAAVAESERLAAERESKLNAYTFKGVTCSVNEADQNGWETINARVKRLVASGEDWRAFPFFMDNGNHVLIESESEWDSFIEAGWQARESIMLARLA